MGSTVTPEKTVMDARWDAAIYEPKRFSDGSCTWAPNKRHDRITRSLQEIAACLIEDGVSEYEAEDLDQTIDTILTDIQRHLYAFAEGHRERWEAHRSPTRAVLEADLREQLRDAFSPAN